MRDIFVLIMFMGIVLMGLELSVLLSSVYPFVIALQINYIIYVIGEIVDSLE